MPIYYFDISKKGKDVLGTKDIPMLTNEQAVKESIWNILLTQPGTSLMDSEKGIDLDRYLFDFVDDLTASMMETDILMGLQKYEPRINNINVVVTPDEENQTFLININYDINFTNSTQEMEIPFTKIR